jgi:hypothetical protein
MMTNLELFLVSRDKRDRYGNYEIITTKSNEKGNTQRFVVIIFNPKRN